MEFLVFMLLIIFLMVSGSGKNRQRGKSPARPAQRPQDALVKPVAPEAKADSAAAGEPLLQQMLSALKAAQTAPAAPVRAAAKKAATAAARPAPVAQGDSDADEEGCVGGSMAHDHHEGESRALHRRHAEAVARREDEETRAALAARELQDTNTRRLRQAVVMAEILDRPVALRRGRRGAAWRQA